MRTALVTGGNRGIGLAISAGLAKQGIRVLIASRDKTSGEAAAAQMTGEIHAVELDLADRSTMNKQLERIRSEHPSVDVLVNNAGILENGSLLEVSEEAFDRSIRTNFLAPVDLIRALVPQMVANGYGRIVNLSSGWGSFAEGLTGPAAYSISKAALNALTLSISQSLPPNVKVNTMCPGWVRTEMGGASADRSPEEGADTAIWLATLPDDGPTGGFFRDRRLIQW
jgi:NAD(P)-dependent dehydrogenase (short-subunit alcohol dehydrogenase family)